MDLSIGITAYNQAQFIEKAIRSVFEQKTTYSIELIIADDASEDNTEQIVQNVLKEAEIPVKYIKNKCRVGPVRNGQILFDNASGKYLSLMDADDYWCYDEKIQSQLDFLEKNPAYAACFHDAAVVSSVSAHNALTKKQSHAAYKTYAQFNKYNEEVFPWDILNRIIIPTASLVFRNTIKNSFFEEFSDFNLSVSWALHLEIIKNSKFKYFNEIWSVYNDHPQGISKTVDLLSFKINNIEILKNYLEDDYYKWLIKDVYRALASECFLLLHCDKVTSLDKKTFSQYCKQYKYWSEKALKAELKSFNANYDNQKLK